MLTTSLLHPYISRHISNDKEKGKLISFEDLFNSLSQGSYVISNHCVLKSFTYFTSFYSCNILIRQVI